MVVMVSLFPKIERGEVNNHKPNHQENDHPQTPVLVQLPSGGFGMCMVMGMIMSVLVVVFVTVMMMSVAHKGLFFCLL